MGIFLRQSYNVKPPRWGSPADIEYAIKVNAEKVYDVDPDNIVLAMPLFWGLPCLDYSGKRNDGTNHGADYKDGELEFDGSSSYVEIANSDSLDITDTVTFFAQVKSTGGADAKQSIITKQSAWQFTMNSLVVAIYLYGIDPLGWRLGTTNIKDGKEHHVAVTYDKDGGSDNLNLYADGQVDNSFTVTGAITENNNEVALGYLDTIGYYRWFNGSIGEACIFNAAFSADQIALFHALPYGLYQPVIRPIYHFITGIPVFMHHFNQMRAA